MVLEYILGVRERSSKEVQELVHRARCTLRRRVTGAGAITMANDDKEKKEQQPERKLSKEQEDVLRRVLQANPLLTREQALRYLEAAGL
jgi:hypothetical protein